MKMKKKWLSNKMNKSLASKLHQPKVSQNVGDISVGSNALLERLLKVVGDFLAETPMTLDELSTTLISLHSTTLVVLFGREKGPQYMLEAARQTIVAIEAMEKKK